jgi:hypothetical protein
MKRTNNAVEVVSSCLITPDSLSERAADGDKYCAYGKRDTDDTEEYGKVRNFTPDAHVRKPCRTTESHEIVVWPPARCE